MNFKGRKPLMMFIMEDTMPVTAGTLAPDFELMDDTGTAQRLSNYRGHEVVLYFYPADFTSGCTIEACNFRDNYSAYQKAGVVILGVSPDGVDSHGKFKRKYSLPFPLLVDANHQVCELYGAWGRTPGRDNDGVLRTTFLIGKDGKVIKVFENVKPSEHSAEVLAALTPHA
jgi:peroxiredoxin Q/BCP